MFFAMFWTTYIPLAVVLLSPMWERLTHLLRRDDASARIDGGNRRVGTALLLHEPKESIPRSVAS